jgi:hypothetical protein
MKCIYFLAPTLASTESVSQDLHAVGVKDFFLHVVSRDEMGLRQHHIQSSNYLETLDIVRDGFIGAALGFIAGMIGVGLLMYFKPLGENFHIPPSSTWCSPAPRRCSRLGRRAHGRRLRKQKLARFDDLVAAVPDPGVRAQASEAAVLKMMRDSTRTRPSSRSTGTSSIRSARWCGFGNVGDARLKIPPVTS